VKKEGGFAFRIYKKEGNAVQKGKEKKKKKI